MMEPKNLVPATTTCVETEVMVTATVNRPGFLETRGGS